MEMITLALAVFLASGIGVATGFGFSVVLFPVLLLFFPFAEMLLFVGILHLATDVWKVTLFAKGIRKNLILLFGAVGAVAAVIGAELSLDASEVILSRLFGGVLIGYAVFAFAAPRFKIRRSLTSQVVGGGISGFLAGLFGIGGPARSAVLAAYDLPKVVYVATSGAIALMIDIPRVAVYFIEGTRVTPQLLSWMVVFIPATFLGALAAKRLLHAIPQQRFQQFILTFLMLIGIKLFLFP